MRENLFFSGEIGKYSVDQFLFLVVVVGPDLHCIDVLRVNSDRLLFSGVHQILNHQFTSVAHKKIVLS